MSLTLEPYPEYKDSGLPWLGEIPAHWKTRPLRRLAHVQLSNIDKHTVDGETPVRLCNYTDVYHRNTITSNIEFMEASALPREIEKFELRRGDVLITKDSESWTDIAVPAYVADNLPGVLCGYHLAQIRPYEDTLRGQYLFRAFQTKPIAYQFHVAANGVTRYGLSSGGIAASLFPIPSKAEQDTIVSFLNRLDQLVNILIRAKQRLTELLTEQKQAIIHRAVTCGLDPDAPMKPTGLDWLPEVPKHWKVKPLKRWAAINSRVLPETTDPEYIFRYLDIGAIGTGFLTEQPELMKFEHAPSRARRALRRGDTIISTVRTYLKAVYFVANEQEDLVASTGFAVLTPVPGIVPEYLSFVIQSNTFIERVMANSVGIAYPAIAEARLGVLHLALPPTQREQLSLVEYIKAETQDIDEAIRRAQREIELIREYRTRLISDVVTGKLDVRGVDLPDPDEQEPGLLDREPVGPKAPNNIRKAPTAAFNSI